MAALTQTLERPETRTDSSEALRGLTDAIILTPASNELKVELKRTSGGDAGSGHPLRAGDETRFGGVRG